MEEAARRGESAPPFAMLEEVTTAPDGHQRSVQDLIRHAMLHCGADAPLERAERGNLARELGKAIPLEKGNSKDTEEAPQSQSDSMEILN